MAKRIIPPRVRDVEETEIGKKLSDPVEQERHDAFIRQFREAARPEIEALQRSERITGEDRRQIIN